MQVVIAAGGTGGHIYPALAVARSLRARPAPPELAWLGGTTWDGLTYMPTARGPVAPGSGVSAPGDQIKLGDGVGRGSAMLCIAGGEIVAGFSGGLTTSLTSERYRTNAKEVCATFRDVNGVPQYVAVPQ